jgi:RES domain-containing protein
MVTTAELMGYYEAQDRRTKQVTARVTKRVYDGVYALARLWTHMERVRHEDKGIEVSAADVVNRLLDLSIDAAFAELGVARPESEDDWKRVLSVVEKKITKTK